VAAITLARWVAVGAAASCVIGAFACSSFDSEDGGGSTNDGGRASDDAPTEASTDAAADSAQEPDADAGSNVLLVENFDSTDPGLPCDGWIPSQTTAIVVDGGRSGRACKVCPTATGGSGDVYKTVPSTLAGTYTTLMYVHSAPDASAASWAISTIFDQEGGVYNATAYSNGTLSPSWDPAQAVAPDAHPVGKVGVRIYALGNPGECVLVDDVRLSR